MAITTRSSMSVKPRIRRRPRGREEAKQMGGRRGTRAAFVEPRSLVCKSMTSPRCQASRGVKAARGASRTSPRRSDGARRPIDANREECPGCRRSYERRYRRLHAGKNPAPPPDSPRSACPVTTTSFPRRNVRMSDDWAGLLASGSNYCLHLPTAGLRQDGLWEPSPRVARSGFRRVRPRLQRRDRDGFTPSSLFFSPATSRKDTQVNV